MRTLPERPLRAALLALLALLAAGAAAAQVRIQRLEIVLWPEYDRPSVLVMLRASLPPDTALPTIVALPMPTAAGTPHAVAKQTEDGNLVVAQHTLAPAGEWTTVNLLTDAPIVRLEYYMPIESSDSQRRFRYFWPGGAALDQVAYEVLHPVGASNLTVNPPADGIVEADGLTFYRAELGARGAADTFSISLAYAKSSARLSSPAAQAAPPPEPETAQPERPAPRGFAREWPTYAMLALAAAILLVLMFRRPRPPAAG